MDQHHLSFEGDQAFLPAAAFGSRACSLIWSCTEQPHEQRGQSAAPSSVCFRTLLDKIVEKYSDFVYQGIIRVSLENLDSSACQTLQTCGVTSPGLLFKHP